ncbi:hypothetical protein HD553DRAFT_303785 [Filobasidium floriforme]|uniref:uncharacterized protein n=1 Tax=Filobasidium floriforme TaxID=5210 RepID=UPI001E8D2EB1|nr:uncharacterized protein HD553DRAFT_303785 [Filobasidium floriforme]KAH8090952.1 hypothetical protein HD553DRAFT_303785 [Filobasidium floriforme]
MILFTRTGSLTNNLSSLNISLLLLKALSIVLGEIESTGVLLHKSVLGIPSAGVRLLCLSEAWDLLRKGRGCMEGRMRRRSPPSIRLIFSISGLALPERRARIRARDEAGRTASNEVGGR